ncbi:MAG: LysM peptidoglycan-binding domain-containing protein [Polyangiales bacterium]
MKKAALVCIMLTLAGLAPAQAQKKKKNAADDYVTQFGGEEAERVEPEDRDTGPHSMTEAKQQHRGYRIGTESVHGTGGKDVHVVQEGDTLWDISAHYFGDPWHWPELWSYNPEITNPHWIYPLDQIRLNPEALTQDRVAAKMDTGGKGELGLGEKGATAGVMSGTEQAPSVVVPRSAWKPGMVFLRDEGYLDDDALRTAGQIIGGNEEHMLLSPSDQVYVKFGSDQDAQAGQSYTVFRTMKNAERMPHEKGTLVKILGTVVVRSYDPEKHVARGVVTEGLDPIERGLFVAKMDRRFDFVAPKPNRSNVVAHIIASVEPRELVSFGNVVFLDVGEGHGIEVGNRFFVVRRGDDWLQTLTGTPVGMGNVVEVPKYDPSALPKEVIAELRVLKVRKNTTVALVTRSDLDLAMGDTAEMRTGF